MTSALFLRCSGVACALCERHVLRATAVDEQTVRHAKRLRIRALLLAERRDSLALELVHRGLDAALAQRALVELQLNDLHDVDGSEPAADAECPVRHLVTRTCIGTLVLVIEPVDEGVLVDEAAIT